MCTVLVLLFPDHEIFQCSDNTGYHQSTEWLLAASVLIFAFISTDRFNSMHCSKNESRLVLLLRNE